jgi:PAS domain S-box-containing protein
VFEAHQSDDQIRELPLLLRNLPAVASAVAICVGTLTILGWFLDLEILKRAFPGAVRMNPTTALCFILVGAALSLCIYESVPAPVRAFAKIIAIFVVLVGTAKLIALFWGWDLHVDDFLFSEKLADPASGVRSQMAAATAVNFVAIGSALLLLDFSKKGFWPSDLLSIVVCFISLAAFIGYLYGVQSFLGIAWFSAMAVHTAGTFLLLSGGVYFVRPNHPAIQLFAAIDSRGVVARWLLPTAIGLTVLLGWLRLLAEKVGLFDARFGLVVHTVGICILLALVLRLAMEIMGRVEAQRVAALRDLAQNKWELQRALNKADVIFNHARQMICTLNESEQIDLANAACETLTGFNKTDLIGRTFYDLHCPDDRQKIEKALQDVGSGLVVNDLRTRCRRRDGTLVDVEWSLEHSGHYEMTFCFGRKAGTRNETPSALSELRIRAT